jgi:hypothetical protein
MCSFRVARVSVRQCDVTGSVTLSDRDRGVTVPDRRGFSPEINPVCFRFMSLMRVPRSVMSCGDMVRVTSRHNSSRMITPGGEVVPLVRDPGTGFHFLVDFVTYSTVDHARVTVMTVRSPLMV